MTNLVHKFSWITASTVLGLAVIGASAANAASIIYDFEVSISSGSLVGENYFGLLEFDDSDLSISQFTFDFEGVNYTEADLIDPEIVFDNDQFLGLVADVIDTDVEFSFLEAVPPINEPATFIYLIDGQEAAGEIAYTLQTVPEPSTLLGSMIIVAFGLGSLVKRQIK